MNNKKRKVEIFTKTGEIHKAKGLNNQDRCSYRIEDSRYALALLDGCGSTNQNSEATQEVADYITSYLIDNGCEYFDKRTFMLGIIRIIESYMIKYGLPKEELSSTVMALYVDDEIGKAYILHIGDGIIFGKGERADRILSYPRNGEFFNQTYTTVSENILKILVYEEINIEEFDELVLMTDGAYSIHQIYNRDLFSDDMDMVYNSDDKTVLRLMYDGEWG